jgi:signal transduction histidine kinase
MPASLHLLVCQFYLLEAQAILEGEGFEDVTVSAFPDLCSKPSAEGMAAIERLFSDSGGDGRTTVLVGACSLSRQEIRKWVEDRFHRIQRVDLCFHMLLNKTTVESCLRAGAHLVTAGWLEDWQQHVAHWQFDQQTAREFFAEGARRLVLLDTGVDPAAESRLQDCAAFLSLPAEVMPVGLDHFRLILAQQVQAWRTGEARCQSQAAFEQGNRKLADYEMAMDMLVNLSRIMDEDEAIKGILDIFSMLFGAGRVAFASTGGNQPGKTQCSRPGPDDATWMQTWIARLKPDDAHATSDTGFCVRVRCQNENLGVVVADDITLPERKQDYLNLALGLVSLCGLAIVNAQSLSRRQRAEAVLRRKTGQLARSNQDLEQFAYSASHDLQEPLRKVMAFGSLLEKEYGDKLEGDGHLYLASIGKATRRMQTLITDLLGYARVTTRGKTFVAVNLNEVVQGVLSDLEVRIGETNAQVNVGDLPEIHADPTQMRQLLQNLIGNALKFHKPDEHPVITVSAEPVTGEGGPTSAPPVCCRIQVKDNGIGFDEKYLERIFGVFQRLHGRDAYEGSGIGLAVSRRIAERHGGTITATSQPGEGATFTVLLPFKHTNEDSDAEKEE